MSKTPTFTWLKPKCSTSARASRAVLTDRGAIDFADRRVGDLLAMRVPEEVFLSCCDRLAATAALPVIILMTIAVCDALTLRVKCGLCVAKRAPLGAKGV
jgi:hypothetical protein